MTTEPITVFDVILGSMVAHFSDDQSIENATPWADVGSDQVRETIFFEAEALFGISLSDDDREQVQTFGEFVRLFQGICGQEAAA